MYIYMSDDCKITNKQRLMHLEEMLEQMMAAQENIQQLVVNTDACLCKLKSGYDQLDKRLALCEKELIGLRRSREELALKIQKISDQTASADASMKNVVKDITEMEQRNQRSLADITILVRDIVNEYTSDIHEVIHLFAADRLIDEIPQPEETDYGMEVIIPGNENIIKLITAEDADRMESMSDTEFQSMVKELRGK